MNKLSLLVIITFVVAASGGCQAQPGDDPPSEPAEAEQQATDNEQTIEKNDQEVNDSNALKDENKQESCPEPRQTDEMCAQVVVWALSPDAHCCEYPTPCHAPRDWETFHSEQECIDATSGGEDTE